MKLCAMLRYAVRMPVYGATSASLADRWSFQFGFFDRYG